MEFGYKKVLRTAKSFSYMRVFCIRAFAYNKILVESFLQFAYLSFPTSVKKLHIHLSEWLKFVSLMRLDFVCVCVDARVCVCACVCVCVRKRRRTVYACV